MHRPTHWWPGRPSWLDALYETETDLRWLSQTKSHERFAALTAEDPAGLSGDWVAFGLERLLPPLRATAVAELPTRFDRTGQMPYYPTLWVDAQRPEQLWLALDESSPAPMWLAAGTTLDAVRAAYAPYAPEGHVPHSALTREFTAFVCWDEEKPFVQLAPLLIKGRMLDRLVWGNVHPVDPWKGEVDINAPSLRQVMNDDLRQADSHRPSFSVRTVFSQSVVRVHPRLGAGVVDVRYRPADSACTIATLNELCDCELPADLPVDAARALLAGPIETIETIASRLREREVPPEGDPERALAFELVRHDATAFAAMVDDDVRRSRWLVREALGRTPDERRLARELAYLLGLFADHAALAASEPEPGRLVGEYGPLDGPQSLPSLSNDGASA